MLLVFSLGIRNEYLSSVILCSGRMLFMLSSMVA